MSDTRYLLDPELDKIVDLIPAFRFTREGLPAFRAARNAEIVLADTAERGVTREEIRIPGYNGPEVRCLLYTPNVTPNAGALRPGYLHVHGGGYIIGSPEGSDAMNTMIAQKLGAVVLSVSYRLAPEHTIPAPIYDCYAGLAWLHSQSEALSLDTTRIGIGGESAGGGLAAATAIFARDQGEYDLCHQHLTYPMLDNLTGDQDHPGDPLVGEFVWTRESNQFGWSCYLGDAEAIAPQVPSRVTDYAGLPPTWMFTATMDLFRDENIVYAQHLMRAGIATDLNIYAGACHGFQMIPGTQIGARYVADHMAALARGLGVQTSSD